MVLERELERGRTDVRQDAAVTARLACVTDLPAVLDQQVREHGPAFARKEGKERLLDLHGVRLVGEGESVAEPRDVRVDDDAVVPPASVAENDVGGLAPYAGQNDERLHVGGDLTTMP